MRLTSSNEFILSKAINGSNFNKKYEMDFSTIKIDKAYIHYEGIGFEGSKGSRPDFLNLNGKVLKNLKSAYGNEVLNEWQKVKSEIPSNIFKRIKNLNKITVINNKKDYFKIRKFQLEIVDNKGNSYFSNIDNNSYTQPENWKYKEGLLVPFGKQIETILGF